jgi:hypothetical protein
LLEVYFNSEGIYNENDKEQIIEFYKNNMAKTRLTESRLKKMISEAVKSAIHEMMDNEELNRYVMGMMDSNDYDEEFEYDDDMEDDPWHNPFKNGSL